MRFYLLKYLAVAWAAFFNFIAFLFFSLHVADTIGRGIVDARIIDPAVAETVDILKGAKAVKVVLAWIVGTVAAGAALWAWVVDHVKVIK